MKPKLSICIPTYNFGKFIGETLESIIPQMTPEVELIILDSNSTDNTEEVCRGIISNNPNKNINYVKSDRKMGVDRDIAKVVEMGKGEYRWLISADDILRPNSVELILKELDGSSDVYLIEHIICDIKMNPLREHPMFNGVKQGEVFDLGNEEERKSYFYKALTTEAFFSFLSSPVFKFEIWDRVDNYPDEFYDTCWGLAGRLLLSARQGFLVKYLGDQVLFKRGENDSFASNGIVQRLGITIEGFGILANKIYGRQSYEARQIRRILRQEVSFKMMLDAKLLAYLYPKRESLARLNHLTSLHYQDSGIKNTLLKIFYQSLNYRFLRPVLKLYNLKAAIMRRLPSYSSV